MDGGAGMARRGLSMARWCAARPWRTVQLGKGARGGGEGRDLGGLVEDVEASAVTVASSRERV